jgi:endonuclease-8
MLELSETMPEGDTIYRAARTLHRVLAGKTVTRFESVFPAVTRIADDHPIVGRTIVRVESRGKHILMVFSELLVLHTHMRMNGSWHIYPAGARWQRPTRDMRVLVGTADAVAVGFNVPIVELLTPRQLAQHEQLRALGPDLLGGDIAEGGEGSFDRGEAIRRLRARERDAIGDALLNQRVVAGIGNVLKSEVLFVAQVNPFTPVTRLSDADVERILDVARELIHSNVLDRSQTLHPSTGRRTTRSMDPNAKLWVYSRGGRPCRRCGAIVQSKKTGVDARLTYWCPVCQGNVDSK